MAHLNMGSDGRSTNTGLTTVVQIDSDGANVVIYNPLNTTVKIQMGSGTALTYNVHYNEEDFELVANNGTIRVPSKSAVRLFVNNSSSSNENMQVLPHGVTTAHGTSVHDGGRIYFGDVDAT